MNRIAIRPLAISGVVLVLAGAVGLTIYTLQRIGDYRATLQRRARDLEGLTTVQADLAIYENAYAVFEACRAAPPPLAALIAGLLPTGQAPAMRDLSEAGPDGWQRRRHELAFDQVPIADAMELARAAEQPLRDAAGNERPGWRLVKCAIRPAPGQPGIGRVVLEMEALARE